MSRSVVSLGQLPIYEISYWHIFHILRFAVTLCEFQLPLWCKTSENFKKYAEMSIKKDLKKHCDRFSKSSRISKEPLPEVKQYMKDDQCWENALPYSTSNVLVKVNFSKLNRFVNQTKKLKKKNSKLISLVREIQIKS